MTATITMSTEVTRSTAADLEEYVLNEWDIYQGKMLGIGENGISVTVNETGAGFIEVTLIGTISSEQHAELRTLASGGART
jgi:hypothetical protein